MAELTGRLCRRIEMKSIGYRVLGACMVILVGVIALPAVGAAPVSDSSLVLTKVFRSQIRGFVFYTDGETPASKVPVRAWDVEQRKFVAETTTDDNGFFELPELPPGEYYITFDWTRLRIEVEENKPGNVVQQAHHVIVVIPRDVAFISIPQLSSVLLATSVSEVARRTEEERPKLISP